MAKRGPKPSVELTPGMKIKALTVISEPVGSKVLVRCECGTEKEVIAADLRRGHTRSCGCARKGARTPMPTHKEHQTEGVCRCCDSGDVKGRGLCGTCYNRAYTHGNLEDVALPSRGMITAPGPASPFWVGDAVDYNGAHTRIRRLRGAAKDKSCAEGCGNPAVAWSYDGHCPQERVDPERNAPYCYHYNTHYQARCKDCHRGWDRDQFIVAAQ